MRRPKAAATAIAIGAAAHMGISAVTIRMAIVYAPIAMNATWPKLSRPVNPNWSCSPRAKIVKIPATTPTNAQKPGLASVLTGRPRPGEAKTNDAHTYLAFPKTPWGRKRSVTIRTANATTGL